MITALSSLIILNEFTYNELMAVEHKSTWYKAKACYRAASILTDIPVGE